MLLSPLFAKNQNTLAYKLLQFTKPIGHSKKTYMLFTDQEVHIEKTVCPSSWMYRPRLQAKVHALKTEGHVFLDTDRPVNNISFPLKFA